MILAQYTIRSKQNYIFKTNRVLEIVGASDSIAKIWDVLFKTAKDEGIIFHRTDVDFNMQAVSSMFDQKKLQMVELFCGGGNETILFDSMDSYRQLNKAFSYKVMADYPGMIPMVVSVEAAGDYSADYEKLMKKTEQKKNVMVPQENIFTVPFAMMDRTTFQPYSHVLPGSGQKRRLSDESSSKYWVGLNLRKNNKDIELFDHMVTEKGKESLLAIVHADGNNMGSKIMGMLQGVKDYDKAVKFMRAFTVTTADCFEKNGDRALKACFENLKEKNKAKPEHQRLSEERMAYRRIIGSGDDVTFICNARFVMDYVKAYLDAVQNYKNTHQWQYSSCAGICIFHSHYPFARAYMIAEQACDDNAKKKVHKTDAMGKTIPVEQGWMDFHFIHSGIGGDLEEIRKSQGTESCIARPWLLSYGEDDTEASNETFRYDKLNTLKQIVKECNVARTSIKTIGSAYEKGESVARKELETLCGHNLSFKDKIEDLFPDETDRLKALYDFGEIYDLWYEEVKR